MLPFRSGRARTLGATGSLLTLGILGYAALGAERSPTPKKGKSPASFASVPLPIGQEAKGLVLPDFDTEGHLRARFEAAIAKRIDADHLQFKGLKMTTYTEQNTPELQIDMPVSTLDLNTRVIDSKERTTVTRSDFNIAGDNMSFDTVARKGTLTGNVKMVITDQSDLRKKAAE
jgi:hypothetical protein